MAVRLHFGQSSRFSFFGGFVNLGFLFSECYRTSFLALRNLCSLTATAEASHRNPKTQLGLVAIDKMILSGEALVQSALRFLDVVGVITHQMGWLELLQTSLENFFGRGVGFASQTFSSIFKTGGFHE